MSKDKSINPRRISPEAIARRLRETAAAYNAALARAKENDIEVMLVHTALPSIAFTEIRNNKTL